MVATVVCQYIHTWHNDACYNILVVQNTKKQVSRCFFIKHTQKFQVCRFEDFFSQAEYPSFYPRWRTAILLVTSWKRASSGAAAVGARNAPRPFFLLAILAASWGLVVYHITISEFSSILQGWKDGFQQYHSNTQVFFLWNLYNKRLFRAQSSLVGEM